MGSFVYRAFKALRNERSAGSNERVEQAEEAEEDLVSR